MAEGLRITKERYQAVINESSKYEVYPHSENEHLPDHKQLAAKLRYIQNRMNLLILDLLNELILALILKAIQNKRLFKICINTFFKNNCSFI